MTCCTVMVPNWCGLMTSGHPLTSSSDQHFNLSDNYNQILVASAVENVNMLNTDKNKIRPKVENE